MPDKYMCPICGPKDFIDFFHRVSETEVVLRCSTCGGEFAIRRIRMEDERNGG